MEQNPQRNRSLLDFGCGVGGFAHEAANRGFVTVGVDPSREMIRKAKEAFPNAEFLQGDFRVLDRLGSFDVITSIMVLQFVNNLEPLISEFSGSLNQVNSELIVATHSPDYVHLCLEADFKFKVVDQGYVMELGDHDPIPVYLRELEDYQGVCQKYGLKLTDWHLPPFPAKYLDTYKPAEEPADVSKFLIMRFQKCSQQDAL